MAIERRERPIGKGPGRDFRELAGANGKLKRHHDLGSATVVSSSHLDAVSQRFDDLHSHPDARAFRVRAEPDAVVGHDRRDLVGFRLDREGEGYGPGFYTSVGVNDRIRDGFSERECEIPNRRVLDVVLERVADCSST